MVVVKKRDAAQPGRGQLTKSHTPNLGDKLRVVLVLDLAAASAPAPVVVGGVVEGCGGGRLCVASEGGCLSLCVVLRPEGTIHRLLS